MRRLADIVAASAILLFTLPLLVLVGLALKYESPGPVFERTERIVSGHRFTLLTFRTTTHDPEFFAPEWARTCTQVGRFLRYTQIDTLPQLINVLRGELSLFDGTGLRGFFSH